MEKYLIKKVGDYVTSLGMKVDGIWATKAKNLAITYVLGVDIEVLVSMATQWNGYDTQRHFNFRNMNSRKKLFIL